MTAYRNDVDALASRQASLAAELAEKTQELSTATQLLEEAQAKSKLPILDNIRVATPCAADWAQMSGDEQVRACGDCKKNVYNLSSLTRDEAEALIVRHEGKLCVRYFQRKDGTILLKDCSVGIGQKRKRRVIAAGATLLLAGTALFAFKRSRPATIEPVTQVLGEIEQPTTRVMITSDDDPPPAPTVIVPTVPDPEEYTQKLGDWAGPVDVVETKGEVVIQSEN